MHLSAIQPRRNRHVTTDAVATETTAGPILMHKGKLIGHSSSLNAGTAQIWTVETTAAGMDWHCSAAQRSALPFGDLWIAEARLVAATGVRHVAWSARCSAARTENVCKPNPCCIQHRHRVVGSWCHVPWPETIRAKDVVGPSLVRQIYMHARADRE